MHLSISFNLKEKGWAICIVSLNGENLYLPVSDLEDALGNLAKATLRIVEGDDLAYAVFVEEPNEFISFCKWKILPVNKKQISVEIIWFDDWKKNTQTDEEGKVIFGFKCDLMIFVQKVITCLSDVLDENGLEGYKETWGNYEFPLNTYNELRNNLTKLK